MSNLTLETSQIHFKFKFKIGHFRGTLAVNVVFGCPETVLYIRILTMAKPFAENKY